LVANVLISCKDPLMTNISEAVKESKWLWIGEMILTEAVKLTEKWKKKMTKMKDQLLLSTSPNVPLTYEA